MARARAPRPGETTEPGSGTWPEDPMAEAGDHAHEAMLRPASDPTSSPQPSRAGQLPLAEILAHIERYKRYPHRARRRGIQGRIRVSLQIHADGSVSKLELGPGPAELRGAAARTIQRALPLPQRLHPPGPEARAVRFTLVFALR